MAVIFLPRYVHLHESAEIRYLRQVKHSYFIIMISINLFFTSNQPVTMVMVMMMIRKHVKFTDFDSSGTNFAPDEAANCRCDGQRCCYRAAVVRLCRPPQSINDYNRVNRLSDVSGRKGTIRALQ